MRDYDIDAEPPRLQVFEGVVTRHLLDEINAAIDASRETWRPADGRRATQAAQHFADMLRQNEGFQLAERQACEISRRWARKAGWELNGEPPLCVLRCVNSGLPAQSHLRHYDSHILTLLIPLQEAQATRENGDLIIYRRQRHAVTVMSNIVAKIRLILLRNLPFVIRRAQTFRHLAEHQCDRIACVPGNVYAFNGFVTLHANLHAEAGERRSLIVHYYDPGLTAGLSAVPRAWRALRDRLLDAFQHTRPRA
ncbi:hypothetical protein [Cupriavidus basilensis]|uniref:hypothetical protein n=1 Tax=Cupriavidus basilensis TaxID=68895 RepID=UPI0020A6CDE4|nr:hypothetical protein [Cupriavidus basilensis]MCP3021708.1 hypothetical protein [Cupriavidus basilensis]